MADSRFAILMALFLPNKELFTKFVKFNHAGKQEEDRWNYFQCHTCKTELASSHNSCVILMTTLSCKLKNDIILLQFVILLKKSHDLLVQLVINRYSWFWQLLNCTRLIANFCFGQFIDDKSRRALVYFLDDDERIFESCGWISAFWLFRYG